MEYHAYGTIAVPFNACCALNEGRLALGYLNDAIHMTSRVYSHLGPWVKCGSIDMCIVREENCLS